MPLFSADGLSEDDRVLYDALSYNSWYYLGDLARLWAVSTAESRPITEKFCRMGALLIRKQDRNHNRQGAPNTLYCRADSFDVIPAGVETQSA